MKTDIDELERLAKAATPGPWMRIPCETIIYDRMSDGCRGNSIVSKPFGSRTNHANLDYIAAASPSAILDLLAENERLADEVNGLTGALDRTEKAWDETRMNAASMLSVLADCRAAVGDDGKRMLPEFVEYLRWMKADNERLSKREAELLGALRNALEMVRDWGGYASPYFQEKYDIDGDIRKLEEVIAKAESQS